jgi:hypothetical protein
LTSRGAPGPGPSNSEEARRVPAYALGREMSPALPLLGGPPQMKLSVSQPNDPAEREADAVADSVFNDGPAQTRPSASAPAAEVATQPADEKPVPAPEEEKRPEEEPVQLQAEGQNEELPEEEEEPPEAAAVQREANGGAAGGGDGAGAGGGGEVVSAGEGAGGGPTVPASFDRNLGVGSSLPTPSRAFFESRLGQDFGDVRVHTGPEAERSARSVGALAYTKGHDVVFGDGQYAPGTARGDRLLAHELSHVVQQQRSGKSRVSRMIRVGGVDLNPAGVTALADDLVTSKLTDIVPGTVSEALVRETVREMQASSGTLEFADNDAVASNVRHRVLLSHYMRQSQGSTPSRMGFSYPDRRSDGTAGVGPKVNDDATAYWGPVQDPSGDYFFDLSPTGLADPYEALVKLFTEQTNPHKRTLIHCDYLISVLQMRSYAENIGPPRFNALVAAGALSAPGEPSMRMKWNGFDDLLNVPSVRLHLQFPFVGGMDVDVPVATTAPLQSVTVAGRGDLIVGDHVVFYNHESYDALIEGTGGIWRLENAIVIDRRGGQLRYQGHGYFSPVTEDALLAGMIRQYNLHIDEARAIVYRIEHGRAGARTAALSELADKYPNVVRKATGGWEIRGTGLCGNVVVRDLRRLTRAEAPGLVHPCSGDIWVNRPVEATP